MNVTVTLVMTNPVNNNTENTQTLKLVCVLWTHSSMFSAETCWCKNTERPLLVQ